MPDETPVKTQAQLEQEKRIAARKEAVAKEQAAAKELAAKRETLKANIGKTFGDATIEDFLADKGIGPKRGDAYLVNFGNPNHSKYIFCEDLITEQGGQ